MWRDVQPWLLLGTNSSVRTFNITFQVEKVRLKRALVLVIIKRLSLLDNVARLCKVYISYHLLRLIATPLGMPCPPFSHFTGAGFVTCLTLFCCLIGVPTLKRLFQSFLLYIYYYTSQEATRSNGHRYERSKDATRSSWSYY